MFECLCLFFIRRISLRIGLAIAIVLKVPLGGNEWTDFAKYHEHGVAFFRDEGDLAWTLDTALDGFPPDALTEVCMCL